MRPSNSVSKSRFVPVCQASPDGIHAGPSGKTPLGKKVHRAMRLTLFAAIIAALSVQSRSQALSESVDSLDSAGGATSGTLDLTYVQPTPRTTLKNYAYDSFGPYASAFTVLSAGLDQATNTPPEWKKGLGGYTERLGSDFGIAIVGTTARYGAAAAFKVDTSYYRCECRGFFLRLRHAVVSTLTARRGPDGHQVFSVPALVSPYAGSMTAVYGWYPSRYNASDAFRMGNYSLLGSVGTNIAREFLSKGPHILFSSLHLSRSRSAREPGFTQ